MLLVVNVFMKQISALNFSHVDVSFLNVLVGIDDEVTE